MTDTDKIKLLEQCDPWVCEATGYDYETPDYFEDHNAIARILDGFTTPEIEEYYQNLWLQTKANRNIDLMTASASAKCKAIIFVKSNV